MTDNDPLITRIPADVERPDKVMSGLTARQLAILGLAGGIAALIYYTGHDYIPVPVVAAAAFFLIAAGVAVALGSRDGLSLDRFVLAAMAHLRSIKMSVSAPEGVAAPPRWCRVRGRLPAPLARVPTSGTRRSRHTASGCDPSPPARYRGLHGQRRTIFKDRPIPLRRIR